MFQIDDLCALAQTYLQPEQVEEIRRAHELGAKAHEGQVRRSGEAYIYHPLAVAGILAEMRMDHQTLVAAMLHDVIEDTDYGKERIRAEFGDEVAEIVDGVSKLTQMNFESRAEAQAQNFRKMMMAMTHDIRVILVKLADRLHNMRTLGAMPLEKRRQKARETLDIYVPMAQRLGMNKIRLELEDLGFAALYPVRYRVITEAIKKARGHRKEIVKQIKTAIKRRLRQEKLAAKVAGREKHIYSIYLKMKNKGLSFSEVYDVYAFRITVETVDMCYRVLGSVHNLYKPVPGKFKDYIAIPKANGYQSLHTVLFGPYGVPIEVQIRTEEMDEVAEAGIAAHWLYKADESSASGSAQKRAREWLRGVLEMQRQAGNSEEFLEHVKIDLFPDEVYVFTPKGEIMELPRGSTAVDLAYAIHSDIGNTCVAARINRRMAPLSSRLANGQNIEIITAPGARPNPAWLNFVVTARARSHIRHFLKTLRSDEAISLGRRMLSRELEAFSLSLDRLGPGQLKQALETYHLDSLEDLLEEIGLGKRLGSLVARQLIPAVSGKDKQRAPIPVHGASAPLMIRGTEGMVLSFAKCCRPIPGDKILGYVSAGRGLVIHRVGCKNVADFRNQPEKWVNVEWEESAEGEFPVRIQLEITNQRGILATIAATISDADANIEDVQMADRDDRYVSLGFTITVHNRKHLARVLRKCRGIPHVTRVTRVR